MALALDASTPAFGSGANDPWVADMLSTPPPNDAMLVAVVTADWFGGTPAFTFTDSQGVLNTARWTSVARYGSLNNGVVEIFTCQIGAAEGDVARTISVSTNLTDDHGGVKVYVFTGAGQVDTASSTGINSGGFADPANVSVTTTLADTWVVGGAVDWDGDGNITSSDTAETFSVGGTIDVACIRKGSARATAGTETLNINPAGAASAGCYGFIGISSTPPPAYPGIPTVADGRLLSTNQLNTTATRTFPAMSGLTTDAGDLIIAIVVAYQTSTGTNAAFSGWSDGFTEFHDSATSTTLAMGAAYLWSDGTETAAPTVTQAGTITGDASLILLSIPGAHATTPPEAGSRASGTTAAADPASFNPTGWDAEATLWISVVGSGMTAGTSTWTATGTTAPTNYTDRVDTNATDTSTIGDCEAAVAFRQLTAASEDVGTAGVDVSNARNGAFVIAVRPAAAAAATNADAGVANVTTAANGPSRSVSTAAGVANVGAAANQPTVTKGTDADAGVANVSTTANQAAASVRASAGVANVGAAANAPSRAVQASSGLASAAVSAQQTTSRVSPTPSSAQASTGALSPSANVGASPSPAGAGVAANQASVSTAASTDAQAGVAAVAAAANQATVSAESSTDAQAGVATVAAAAGQGTVRVAPVPSSASVIAAAGQGTVVTGTFASAGVANVGAVANQAGGLVSLSAGVAGVTVSSSSSPSIQLHAGLAGVAVAGLAARGSVGPSPAPADVVALVPSTSQRVLVGAGVAAAGAVAGPITMGVPDVLATSVSDVGGPGSSPAVEARNRSTSEVGPT